MQLIEHIGPLAEAYDAFLFDLWGVVHNGIRPYPGALRTLEALRAAEKPVILLSNAPRRGIDVDPFLAKLGVERRLYARVVASGDLVRRALEGPEAPFGRRFVFWGKGQDRSITRDLDYREVTRLEEADFILCCGLDNDAEETPADYAERLHRARAAGLTLVCANPDFQVMRGDEVLPCAGALARDYEAIGGRAAWFGKPFGNAYDYCREVLDGIDFARVLAVGDTIRTDIAGAEAAGLASVLVTGGIHGDELMSGGAVDVAKVEAACDSAGVSPLAVMAELDW